MWVCLGDSSDKLFQGDDDTGYQKFWAEGYKKLPRAFTFEKLEGVTHDRVMPERSSKEHGRDQADVQLHRRADRCWWWLGSTSGGSSRSAWIGGHNHNHCRKVSRHGPCVTAQSARELLCAWRKIQKSDIHRY
jgi:hypothetical protein